MSFHGYGAYFINIKESLDSVNSRPRPTQIGRHLESIKYELFICANSS